MRYILYLLRKKPAPRCALKVERSLKNSVKQNLKLTLYCLKKSEMSLILEE